jgi:hypothetical protein
MDEFTQECEPEFVDGRWYGCGVCKSCRALPDGDDELLDEEG